MVFQIPPLHLAMNTRSGDISGHTAYGASSLDGSGWTVNYRTTGTASGAVQSRPASPALGGQVGAMEQPIPWLLLIGAVVAIKMLKQ